MPLVSKLRLSILLLFLQLFVYLYVVPRESGPDVGFPEACRTSAAHPTGVCLAGNGYFRRLAGNCGRARVLLPVSRREVLDVVEELALDLAEQERQDELALDTGGKGEDTRGQDDLQASKPNLTVEPRLIKREAVRQPEKSSNLVYQIIVVLLFLSVSFALADCFQERAKKKSPEMEREESLNRRMSLADLTMSRHARKESQASYRPLGEKRPLLATRSCSHEVPMKSKAVIRQTSCPQFDDDTQERRRVRMIQRH